MAATGFLQQLFTKPDRLNYLADEAKEFAFQHGLIIRTNETPNSSEVRTSPPKKEVKSNQTDAIINQAKQKSKHHQRKLLSPESTAQDAYLSR